MFREGILNGPQEVKEQASLILGEIIKLTSEEALKPSVVHITGPLIRILGDRFNYSVKVAILDTLGLLLEKVCKYYCLWLLSVLILRLRNFSVSMKANVIQNYIQFYFLEEKMKMLFYNKTNSQIFLIFKIGFPKLNLVKFM